MGLSFLRGFSINAGAGGLTFALAFANQALIARGLGTAGRGQLAFVATSVTIGAMVLGEWLSRGNSFYSGRQAATAGSVWRNTVAYCLVLLLPGAALVAVLPWAGMSGLDAGACLLLVGMVVATVAQKGFTGILQGRDRLTAYALVPLLFISTYLLVNAIGLIWLGGGVVAVFVAWFCGALLAALLAAWLSRAAGRVDTPLLRSTAVVGTRGALSATLIFLLFRSDVYLVRHYLGEEVLGVYAIAVVIAEMMQRGPNIAGAVLLPKVLRGVDDDHGMSLAVSRWVLLFSLLAALGVVVAGAPLIRWIFGEAYSGAYIPLLWMLPGLVASGYGSVLNTKLAGEGYPPVTMWAPGLSLGLNIGLNLLLIPRYGLTGAALSTSVAYGLWALVVTLAYRRRTAVPVPSTP